MKVFRLSDIESFSQIKAHTFRSWEQRFNILKPRRTETNFRYYTLDEVKHLLDIALLTRRGYRISEIAKMDIAAIKVEICSLKGDEERTIKAINNLIVSMFSLNIDEFEHIIDDSILYFGVDYTLREVIVPFMERVDLLSFKDKSNEVHFAVSVLRKKLILGIESIRLDVKSKQTAIFFLPEGEHFDLVLLYMAYLIKGMGIKVLYLGTNVSVNNLKMLSRQKPIQYFFTHITALQTDDLGELVDFMKQSLPYATLFVSGLSGKISQANHVKHIHFRYAPKYVERSLLNQQSS